MLGGPRYLHGGQLFQDGHDFQRLLGVLVSVHLLFVVPHFALLQHEPHVWLCHVHVQLAVHPRQLGVARARKLQRAHQGVTQLHLKKAASHGSHNNSHVSRSSEKVLIINSTAHVRGLCQELRPVSNAVLLPYPRTAKNWHDCSTTWFQTSNINPPQAVLMPCSLPCYLRANIEVWNWPKCCRRMNLSV